MVTVCDSLALEHPLNVDTALNVDVSDGLRVLDSRLLKLLDAESLVVTLPDADTRALIDALSVPLDEARAESSAETLVDPETAAEFDTVSDEERLNIVDGVDERAADSVRDGYGEPVDDTDVVNEWLVVSRMLPDTQAVALSLGASGVAEKRALDVV